MLKAFVRGLNGPLLMVGGSLLMVSASPAFGQEAVKSFNVPAQAAETGILKFAQQANIQFMASEKLVKGKQTNAVVGDMSVRQGLDRLLAGTNLTPVTRTNNIIVLADSGAGTSDRGASMIRTAFQAPSVAASESAPQDETVEELVVTGIRGSLTRARTIKRNAPNSVESIVAEDIGKMPDLNLAESIQRVPGVAMSREGGEGRNITLRGFGPDFTRTTLNGMEVPASSDGLDTGGVTLNAGRAFDFHLFASELFNRIDIEKSQKASTEEGGIAGTVNLYSARPFDFRKDFTVSASLQANYNTLTEKADPRAALLVSKTFADGKLGALFSIAASERTVQQDGYSSVRWTSPYVNGDSWFDSNPTVTGTPVNCGAADRLDCLWAPRLPRADYFGNDQSRIGLTASFQYRPTDNALITLDVLQSQLTNDRFSYNSMEWLLTHGAPGNFTGQTPRSFTIGADGKTLVAARFDDVTSWYESRHQKSDSTFNQVVLSGKFDLTDRLTLDAMAGTAVDDADRSELRFYYRSIPHPYAYDYTDNPYVPTVSYGSYDPNLASNYINAQTASNRINTVKKENVTSRFDATYSLDSLILKGGLSYNDRKVSYTEGLGAAPTFNPSAYTRPFPIDNFGSGLDGPGLLPFRVADFDAIDAAGIVTPGYTNNAGAAWRVGEETLGAYGEMNAEYDVAGMPLRVNAGLRYVKTNVTSEAEVRGTPVKVEVSYDNYLPSINLALDVRPDVVVRASYGRSMTRPGLSTLNVAGPTFGYTTRTVGNVGNPSLKPYESNDIDLGVEWYFGKEGLLSLTAFNKDIVRSLRTDVVTQMIDPSFWPAIYADPLYDASYNADPAKVPYTFTIPVNNDDGNSVKGFEVTYNQPFTFLPGFWSNFGVASNYTHVKANDSTGLSPNSYNLTLYYDTEAYGARISVNKRDDYLLSEPGGNGHVQERKYGPTHVDFASFYNVSENLTLTLEGINITDEVERIYGTGDTGDMDLTREYTHTGAQWVVGLRYKY